MARTIGPALREIQERRGTSTRSVAPDEAGLRGRRDSGARMEGGISAHEAAKEEEQRTPRDPRGAKGPGAIDRPGRVDVPARTPGRGKHQELIRPPRPLLIVPDLF